MGVDKFGMWSFGCSAVCVEREKILFRGGQTSSPDTQDKHISCLGHLFVVAIGQVVLIARERKFSFCVYV